MLGRPLGRKLYLLYTGVSSAEARLRSPDLNLIRTAAATVLVFGIAAIAAGGQSPAAKRGTEPIAAAVPLFRDPVHDGAADPVVVWNRAKKAWWMFYTNRRADLADTNGVTWVH